MTGGPIEGSLRRTILAEPDKGSVIPDSRRKLEDVPLVLMNPGTERFVMRFEDGLGLIDSYGNIYEGYGRTGSSVVWVNNPASMTSISPVLDNAEEGEVPVYDPDTGLYAPVQLTTGSTTLTIEKPQDRNYYIALSLPFDVEVEGGSFTLEAGTGDVIFPSGFYPADDPLFVTVTDTDDDSSFMIVQVNWRRR